MVILLDQRFFSRSQCNPTQLHAFSILSVVTLCAVKNLACIWPANFVYITVVHYTIKSFFLYEFLF